MLAWVADSGQSIYKVYNFACVSFMHLRKKRINVALFNG